MSALRSAISRLPRAANTLVVPTRGTHVVSGPPRNKISSLEKACHGLVIVTGCCIVPGWVLMHMRDYRGRPE